MGPRDGVCRDFAVVGYCDKGIDCEKQHVRECPDFAEKGVCPNRQCKLPHVIRANRRRQPATSSRQPQDQSQTQTQVEATSAQINPQASAKEGYDYLSLSVEAPVVSKGSETSGVAEEYISLTFEESDEDDEDDDEEDSSEDDQDPQDSLEEKGTLTTSMD